MLRSLIPYQDQEILRMGPRSDKTWMEAYEFALQAYQRRLFHAIHALGFALGSTVNGNKITLSVTKPGKRPVIIRAQICKVEALVELVRNHPDL